MGRSAAGSGVSPPGNISKNETKSGTFLTNGRGTCAIAHWESRRTETHPCMPPRTITNETAITYINHEYKHIRVRTAMLQRRRCAGRRRLGRLSTKLAACSARRPRGRARLRKLDKQFPAEQFEATVSQATPSQATASQATVPFPPPLVGRARLRKHEVLHQTCFFVFNVEMQIRSIFPHFQPRGRARLREHRVLRQPAGQPAKTSKQNIDKQEHTTYANNQLTPCNQYGKRTNTTLQANPHLDEAYGGYCVFAEVAGAPVSFCKLFPLSTYFASVVESSYATFFTCMCCQRHALWARDGLRRVSEGVAGGRACAEGGSWCWGVGRWEMIY